MPQPSFSPPSRKRSASPPSPPVSGAKEGPSSGIFTADLPDSPLDEPASEEDFSPSQADTPFPPDGSLNATEPFPEGLFRLPLPDWLFSKMAGMSDSALRSLLGLTRLSFRFDPEASKPDAAGWVKPARSFTRKEIESETGLSSQGARNGLAELAEAGHVSIDTSGRSFEYTLEISVPTSRYTYIPTAFLEAASALSGTELRLVLTVLRATWGWTTSSDRSRRGSSKGKSVEHRRWARLSIAELARRIGRSETAIKDAATQLQGRYLERLRPTGGAYYYRFLPEAVRPDTNSIEEGSGETSRPSGVRVKKKAEARIRLSLYGGIANDLAMDRQKSDPPYANREFTLEKKAKQGAREEKTSSESAPPERSADAVLGNPSSPSENKRRGSSRSKSRAPSQKSSSRERKSPSSKPESSNRAGTSLDDIDLSGFSERLQELGEILTNVGVRPRCVPALLTCFSARRIEANLQLYRRRAPAVQKPGAWLYAAITQGFALPSPKEAAPKETGTEGAPSGRSSETNPDGDNSFLPEPGEKVSETLRRELIREGLAREEEFDKFNDYDDPDRKQHFFQLEKAESPATG